MADRKSKPRKPKAKSPGPIQFHADEVAHVPTKDLNPHPSNAKKHSPAQVEQIAASMVEWGWPNPIVATRKNVILAGHGRHMAATQLGLDTVPVVYVVGWTEQQERAFLIADNKIAENGTWVEDLLLQEVQDLKGGGFDISTMGVDLAAMLPDGDKPKTKRSSIATVRTEKKQANRECTCPNCGTTFQVVL